MNKTSIEIGHAEKLDCESFAQLLIKLPPELKRRFYYMLEGAMLVEKTHTEEKQPA